MHKVNQAIFICGGTQCRECELTSEMIPRATMPTVSHHILPYHQSQLLK